MLLCKLKIIQATWEKPNSMYLKHESHIWSCMNSEVKTKGNNVVQLTAVHKVDWYGYWTGSIIKFTVQFEDLSVTKSNKTIWTPQPKHAKIICIELMYKGPF